eukprot:scaffold161020_cov31-Tisochrysis_lutea.AAC.3
MPINFPYASDSSHPATFAGAAVASPTDPSTGVRMSESAPSVWSSSAAKPSCNRLASSSVSTSVPLATPDARLPSPTG